MSEQFSPDMGFESMQRVATPKQIELLDPTSHYELPLHRGLIAVLEFQLRQVRTAQESYKTITNQGNYQYDVLQATLERARNQVIAAEQHIAKYKKDISTTSLDEVKVLTQRLKELLLL